MRRVLFLVPALFLSAALRAEDVLILAGDPGPLQDQILAGLRGALTVPHKDLPAGADVASALGADTRVIVALGAAAADRARAASSLPVVVTGVPNLHDKDWKDAVKVHVDVRPEDLLGALKEVYPGVKNIGVIHSAAKSAALMARIKQAASAAGVVVTEEPCDSTSAIAAALRAMRGRVDAFWMIMDPLALNPVAIDLIFQFSSAQKVFLISPLEPYAQRGAAMAVTADYAEVGALTAEAVQAVLKRSARRDYFVARPRFFFNAAAVSHLGLKLSPEARAKAKKVY